MKINDYSDINFSETKVVNKMDYKIKKYKSFLNNRKFINKNI